MKKFKVEWKGLDAKRQEVSGELVLEHRSRLAAYYDAIFRLKNRGIEVTFLNAMEVENGDQVSSVEVHG